MLTAKEISSLFGVSYQTVNYYTNLGLLKFVKIEGNKRFYDKAEVEKKLAEINKMKNEGYPLRLICKKFNPDKIITK